MQSPLPAMGRGEPDLYESPAQVAGDLNVSLLGTLARLEPALVPPFAMTDLVDPGVSYDAIVDRVELLCEQMPLKLLGCLGLDQDPVRFKLAANLPARLARSARQVTIVEAELGAPVFASDAGRREGLIDMLLYGCSYAAVARESGLLRVHLITAGSHPWSGEPIHGDEWERVLETLRRHSDLTIVTTTTALPGPILSMLARRLDSILIAYGLDAAGRDAIRRSYLTLWDMDAPILGLVTAGPLPAERMVQPPAAAHEAAPASSGESEMAGERASEPAWVNRFLDGGVTESVPGFDLDDGAEVVIRETTEVDESAASLWAAEVARLRGTGAPPIGVSPFLSETRPKPPAPPEIPDPRRPRSTEGEEEVAEAVGSGAPEPEAPAGAPGMPVDDFAQSFEAAWERLTRGMAANRATEIPAPPVASAAGESLPFDAGGSAPVDADAAAGTPADADAAAGMPADADAAAAMDVPVAETPEIAGGESPGVPPIDAEIPSTSEEPIVTAPWAKAESGPAPPARASGEEAPSAPAPGMDVPAAFAFALEPEPGAGIEPEPQSEIESEREIESEPEIEFEPENEAVIESEIGSESRFESEPGAFTTFEEHIPAAPAPAVPVDLEARAENRIFAAADPAAAAEPAMSAAPEPLPAPPGFEPGPAAGPPASEHPAVESPPILDPGFAETPPPAPDEGPIRERSLFADLLATETMAREGHGKEVADAIPELEAALGPPPAPVRPAPNRTSWRVLVIGGLVGIAVVLAWAYQNEVIRFGPRPPRSAAIDTPVIDTPAEETPAVDAQPAVEPTAGETPLPGEPPSPESAAIRASRGGDGGGGGSATSGPAVMAPAPTSPTEPPAPATRPAPAAPASGSERPSAVPGRAPIPPAGEAATARGGGPYGVHVSSFRTRTKAEEDLSRYQALGFDGVIVGVEVPGKGTWLRVMLGPYPTPEEANRILETVRVDQLSPSAQVFSIPR